MASLNHRLARLHNAMACPNPTKAMVAGEGINIPAAWELECPQMILTNKLRNRIIPPAPQPSASAYKVNKMRWSERACECLPPEREVNMTRRRGATMPGRLTAHLAATW